MNILLVVISWRVLLFIISYITSTLFSFTPSFPYSDVYLIPSHLPSWIWSWANFDGVHYLTIAKGGYWAQFTQAFFPLFPILLRLSGWLLRDQFLIISGLIFNFFCFWMGLMMFFKLLRLDYQNNDINNTLISLLIFPTSFYFGAVYTESLFFLLVISSFYFARVKRWWLSGIFGALASATRITGILLLPALLYEWYMSNSKFQILWQSQMLLCRTNSQKILHFTSNILHLTLKSPMLYLVPIGLITYMAYLQIKFGDWFYFWHAQPAFGAARSGGDLIIPLQVMWRYLKMILTVNFSQSAFGIVVIELVSFILVIILLTIAHTQKVRLSYLIFSWLVVLVPTLTGTLSSMPRYILIAFPIYIVLGQKRIIFWIFGFISASLLIYFTSQFLRGLWVA